VLLVPERVQVVLRGSRLVERGPILENGHPVNRAVAVERIERASGSHVRRVSLHDVDAPEALRGAPVGPDEIAVFRPHTQPRASALAARTPESPRTPMSETPDTRIPSKSSPTRPHALHRERHDRWRDQRSEQHGGLRAMVK